MREKAEAIFATFDDNEKFGVAFGMFPANKMPEGLDCDETRELAVALMKLAKEAGGPSF